MSPHVIPLPWTRPPLSLNDRGHWRARAAEIKHVRHQAHYVIRGWMTRHHVGTLAVAEIELVWRVPDMRRRDLDNLTATLKPTIDGAVDAGLLTGDDWRVVRRSGCRIEPPSADREPAVWLEVMEMTP